MILTRSNAKVVIPIIGIAVVVVVLLVLSGTSDHTAALGESGAPGSIWTCSMHPQVRQNTPGDCPICGMDLIPVEDEPTEGATGERRLSVTDAGRKLMEIDTANVERKVVSVEVPLVGRVAYDESRVARIAAWVPGRIDELYVDYIGYEVRKGEPMVDLYGPMLLAAQEELIQSSEAHRAAAAAGKSSLAKATLETLEAVRERLRLWGLSEEQIRGIEERGTAEPHVTIVAPVGGTVVEKDVTEGAYVSTGRTLFTIADLSVVWIEFSAYESDLTWLAEGQPVEFTVEALPGETFEGAISFVEPIVDPKTRTVTARAEAANADGRLKPDMFARGIVRAVAHGPDGGAPVVIPATAPLLTGRRAIVYVEVQDAPQPTFEGREVVLGPRAGDYYVVISGLSPGEQVVSEGAFKIDSALQIRAKPSMMSPGGDAAEGAATPGGHTGHTH